MTNVVSKSLKDLIKKFLQETKKHDLLTTYLFFLEKKHNIQPVIYLREKMIYQDKNKLLEKVEKEGKLWRETEITIQVGTPSVNENTRKIYICPFTGKVFGDNTHANPQDAIYDWVSKCPENKERVDGIKVKRFFVSEDPDMIKNYIQKRKEPIKKTVFSSGLTGKLFNSKKAVIEDFEKNQLKPISLREVPSQNRFQIEDSLLQFIQDELEEVKVQAFVDSMGDYKEFTPYVEKWIEENK